MFASCPRRAALLTIVLAFCLSSVSRGQDEFPILKLEAGPSNFISQLAFDPQGGRLYAAGWDKVVYVWNQNPETKQFEFAPRETYRIPIGPGGFGLINAMTVSPDGRWLAVGGRGWSRGYAGVRSGGLVWPERSSDPQMLLDRGQVYVWDTVTRDLKVFRGHRGVVKAITFARRAEGPGYVLVTAAEEVAETGVFGVLRAWDLDTRRELAAKGGLPAAEDWVPVLKPLGAGSRVSLAWGDDVNVNNRRENRLRIWDIPRNDLTALPAPPYTLTVDVDRQSLWTGAIGNAQPWDTSRANPAMTAPIPLGRWVPLASAPVRQNGALAQIAYVMRYLSNDRPSQYKLALVNTRTKQIRSPLANWTDGAVQSPIAASADGSTLALARDSQIRIYSIRDLVAAPEGQAAAAQVIAGVGQQAEQVQVVGKEQASGLLIAYTQAGARKQVVFHLNDSVFDPNVAAWQQQAADLQGWSAEASVRPADQRRIVTTRLNNQPQAVVDVFAHFPPEGLAAGAVEITATAIVPPQQRNPALVAVAYTLNGEPLIDLFDAAAGTFYRTFSGHTAAVNSLTFRADGQWLLSTSADRTINVWNVADLPETTLGKIGILNDLVVTNDEQQVVVYQGGADAAAAGLAKGDRILGFVEEGQAIAIGRSWDFYQHVSRKLPGDTVRLQTTRQGAARNVDLKVSQGADERKPLYSLFFDLRGETPQWIAWTPLGKYDVSDLAFERLLGWQFNSPDMQGPVQYATAAEYRETSREPDLLRKLMGIEPVELPVPETQIGFIDSQGEELQADENGAVIVRTATAKLFARVEALEPKWIESLTWRMAENPAQELANAFGSVYTAEIARPGDRLPQSVEVLLRTRDGREFRYQQSLQFVPARPQITKTSPASPITTVNEPAFTLAGDFILDAPKAAIQVVHVLPDGSKQEIPADRIVVTPQADGKSFTFQVEAITLQEGSNQLIARLSNAGATEATRALEEIAIERTVFYSRQEPPALEITRVITLPEGDPVSLSSSGTATVVTSAAVQLTGTLRSKTAPLLSLGGQPMALVQQGEVSEFSVKLPFSGPGDNAFVLTAENAGGKQELPLAFRYEPELPRVRVRLAQAGAKLQVTGDDRPQVQVVADIERANEHASQWELQVNGETQAQGQVAAGRAEIPVTLVPDPARSPDVQQLALRVSNAWNQSRVIPLGRVELKHAPAVELASLQQIENKPMVELAVRVSSPFRKEVTDKLYVNGTEQSAAREAELVEAEPHKLAYLVKYVLPVSSGKNVIGYRATNSDGESSLLTESIEVASAVPPAQIRIEYPIAGRSLMQRDVECKIYVGSPTPPRAVELIVYGDGYPRERIAVPAEQIEQVAPHGYLVRHMVNFTEGKNRLAVRVENEGGTASASIDLAVQLPPVSITIDQFVSIPDGVAYPATVTRQGITTAKPVASGRVRVKGSVRWSDRSLVKPNSEILLRMWTNGFLRLVQLPVGNQQQASFDVTVMLNQAENRIRVEVPTLAVEETSRMFVEDIRLATSMPDTKQRLRLLGMGIRMEAGKNTVTEAELLQRIQTALHVNDTENKAFGEIISYGPLAADRARPTTFISEFLKLASDVKDSQLNQDFQDVVLIYYQGEAVEDRQSGFILQDVENWRRPAAFRSSSITSQRLVTMLQSIPGAHVLLLDVAEQSPPNVAQAWPREPTLGIMRLAHSENPAQPRGEESYLLSLLSSAVESSRREGKVDLRRVAEVMRQETSRLTETPVVYDPHLPPDLNQLIIFD